MKPGSARRLFVIFIAMIIVIMMFETVHQGCALDISSDEASQTAGAEKGKAPMSDKTKDGAKVSEDAKAKGKDEGHEAKMGKMDMMDKKGMKKKK